MAILAASTEDSISIIIWVLVLVALLVPLAAATLWLRKWAHQDAGEEPTVGFTLHDAQQMFKRGELNEVQYERLRQEIIAQSRRALEAKAKPGEAKDGNKP
jgi:uncharacterized membrane protein